MFENELENFYWSHEEPNRSCFLALRDIILSSGDITTAYKYKLPFFLYKGKMFCYLWLDKKTKEPYIGVVKGGEINHSALIKGDRKKMKILPINPDEDIDVELINEIIALAKKKY